MGLAVFAIYLLAVRLLLGNEAVKYITTVVNMRTVSTRIDKFALFVWAVIITAVLLLILPVLSDNYFNTSFFEISGSFAGNNKLLLFFGLNISLFFSIIINEKYLNLNLKSIIFRSFIVKLLLLVVCLIFTYFGYNNIIYFLLCTLVLYGLFKSENKYKYIFKLAFIIQFLTLLNSGYSAFLV